MTIPVILSGGAGTRLWPVSRLSHPKPFIQLPDGKCLLRKTFERASGLNNISEIITITNKDYYLKCKAEYGNTGNLQQSFILEPISRNTAPAIILAALKAYFNNGPDTILLVLPADHLIANQQAFAEACETACAFAKTGKIVTFGIKPTTPETGFGYIECGLPSLFPQTYQVKQFVEKPSADIAETYVRSGQFFWNSGMFCFKAQTLLDELKKHAPELLQQMQHCWHETMNKNTNPMLITVDKPSFMQVQAISIDYALMEKSQEAGVVTCDFDWQDIGSWKAYKNLYAQNDEGNTILGDAIMIDSKNNFIYSQERIIASVGVNNLFIIDTPDALLVSHCDRSQEVSCVVQELKNNSHDVYMNHRTMFRPWGSYTILEEGEGFKIKRIMIKPHSSLSLQSHQCRSEHWVVVQGTADIVNGDKQYQLHINESTFVPVNTLHRISNTTSEELIIIEVQSGGIFG